MNAPPRPHPTTRSTTDARRAATAGRPARWRPGPPRHRTVASTPPPRQSPTSRGTAMSTPAPVRTRAAPADTGDDRRGPPRPGVSATLQPHFRRGLTSPADPRRLPRPTKRGEAPIFIPDDETELLASRRARLHRRRRRRRAAAAAAFALRRHDCGRARSVRELRSLPRAELRRQVILVDSNILAAVLEHPRGYLPVLRGSGDPPVGDGGGWPKGSAGGQQVSEGRRGVDRDAPGQPGQVAVAGHEYGGADPGQED